MKVKQILESILVNKFTNILIIDIINKESVVGLKNDEKIHKYENYEVDSVTWNSDTDTTNIFVK